MTTHPSTSAAGMPLIRLSGLAKAYGGVAAVRDLSLDLHAGEFFALLGPSGCGKTTLLRMLAGFETPDRGQILLDGRDIAPLPPYRRPVNMMFQSYALFPHLTVESNIAFGLRREGLCKAEIGARVAEMVRLGRLEGLEARKPHQLSGGQRQRVALVRALAKRPRVLLLDEPLAALDKKLREDTQFELMELQRRLGLTFIIVTHDQDEAMTLASRIGVMEAGQLAQVGTPQEIYEHPATRAVAGFVGDINLIEGEVIGHEGALALFRPSGGGGPWRIAAEAKAGEHVTLALRPERLALARTGEAIGNVLEGRVIDAGYLGDTTHYRVQLADGALLRFARQNASRQDSADCARGAALTLTFAADAASLLRA